MSRLDLNGEASNYLASLSFIDFGNGVRIMHYDLEADRFNDEDFLWYMRAFRFIVK